MSNQKKSKGISLDMMAGSYDKITFSEKSSFRKKQIQFLNLKKGEKVLEVGCGPGTLSILAKMQVGDKGKVSGIDIAPKMIVEAQKKANKYHLKINFQTASIDKLPFPDSSMDAVISSLMFHHLPVEIKQKGLKEIHRVLKKRGRFLLSDFMVPNILTAPLMFLLLIWIPSTRFQLLGKLPGLIKKAGFKQICSAKKGLFLKHYLVKK